MPSLEKLFNENDNFLQKLTWLTQDEDHLNSRTQKN